MVEARRLHVLRAGADHRTVTAAAAAPYLTPSAVSQQLTALEQETGHRLVERGAKGVRLTPAGRDPARPHQRRPGPAGAGGGELAAYSSGAAGSVTVASFATGVAQVVSPAVARLARTAPGIRIRVRDAEGDASLPMLLDRQVDVAVAVEYRGAPPADDPRLAHVPLYAGPFDAVVPVSHRLAEAAEVPLAGPAKDPWIGPYPGNPCHDVVVPACESAGFQPRLEHSADDFRAVVALASADRGSPSCRAPRRAARTSPASSSGRWTGWRPRAGSSPPSAGARRGIR
ncbi:LysR family transcriptional regulator [Streptomyces cinereospinus]